MTFVDRENDVAFRKIFGNKKKTKSLISFLNAVLELEVALCVESIPFKWVQEDKMEYSITERLVEKGVSKKDIVIGYFPDYHRPYTEYAVG